MNIAHTCYRIGDPKKSEEFYTALGLEKRRELPIRDEAMNYFYGVPGQESPELELTYNFDTKSYDLGTGYGHVALNVKDLKATLKDLAKKGIDPEKPPYTVSNGGHLICFVRDPDGYRIELVESKA